MSDDLVPVDDPCVTEFRRWLRDAREWCSTRAERNDLSAAYDEAGALISSLRDQLIATPFPTIVHDRMVTEWETTVVNPEWPQSAANDRRTLLAWARALLDFIQALFPGDHGMALVGDLMMRAEGMRSLVGAEIPPSNRYGFNPWLMDFMKAQSIRLAHYNAGLETTNWRAEHAKIYPDLSDDTRKVWNSLVSGPERRDCRRVGKLVRRNASLGPEDAAIQLQATQYEAAVLCRICGSP